MDSFVWFLVPIAVAILGLALWFIAGRIFSSGQSSEDSDDQGNKQP